jgi:hypothetical protein
MKKRFTLEQHCHAASNIHQAAAEIRALFLKLSKHYPNNSKVVRRAYKADNVLSELKSELDNCICKENPDRDDVTRIYYPVQ